MPERSSVEMKLVPVRLIDLPDECARENPLDGVEELSESIERIGLLQNLVVRKSKDNGRYVVVAGARRLLALKQAGVKNAHVTVRNLDDKSADLCRLSENVCRKQFSPLEEAREFRRVMGRYRMSAQDVAREVGVPSSTISERLSLLTLPSEIQEDLKDNKISYFIAKEIARIRDRPDCEQIQLAVARKVQAFELPRSEAKKLIDTVCSPDFDLLGERLQKALLDLEFVTSSIVDLLMRPSEHYQREFMEVPELSSEGILAAVAVIQYNCMDFKAARKYILELLREQKSRKHHSAAHRPDTISRLIKKIDDLSKEIEPLIASGAFVTEDERVQEIRKCLSRAASLLRVLKQQVREKTALADNPK